MARPREFDEGVVLDAAVQCFWEHGYEATSIRNLAQNMGITGASLYNAFGDKRSLYHRALNHYVGQRSQERLDRLESQLPPRQAIAGFFDEIIERSLGDPQHKGCMVVNAALELAPHDPECQQAVADVFNQLEAFFRRCILAGQRAGSISIAQSADDLARMLLGIHLGIRVLSRMRPERERLEGLVRPALALLDSPLIAQEA
ncbi:MAG: TetR family transcriptional regulator [Pseudomonas sp.]|nr:TetR family transcriptional regulator [Pseudomonas sp.]